MRVACHIVGNRGEKAVFLPVIPLPSAQDPELLTARKALTLQAEKVFRGVYP